MTTRPAGLATLALVLCLATGCADDQPTGGGPATAATAATAAPSTAQAWCDVVGAEQLSGWAGRPVPAASGATGSGTTECRAVSEDGAIVITWQTQSSAGTLDDDVALASPDGLERSSITVGGAPAALLVGSVTGSRHAKVVAMRGDESLYVDVGWLADLGPTASFGTLRDLAVGVAERAISS